MAKRILIVDDEQSILDLLSEVLTEQGYAVDCAANAGEAIELVRGQMFDAAIVDFNLPGMNGVMLHREIRQLDEELGEHTLFVSGISQSAKDMDYYTAFGVGFLAKPFQVSDVLAALDDLWDAAGD